MREESLRKKKVKQTAKTYFHWVFREEGELMNTKKIHVGPTCEQNGNENKIRCMERA